MYLDNYPRPLHIPPRPASKTPRRASTKSGCATKGEPKPERAMERNHMLDQPPSYSDYSQSHDPQRLNLPAPPKTEPAPVYHDRTLPPLPATLPDPQDRHHHSPPAIWPSSNPLSAYYQPSNTLSPIHDGEQARRMDIDETMSDTSRRAGSVLSSIDDPDVRIAAEALGDLRADFVGSPPNQYSNLPQSPSVQGRHSTQQAEPLLSLLTTTHPLIGNAIGGSLSAYSASKNYSPRFKSSAEYVERNLTPVVNTVGSVGRVTGVEGGVRWFLGGRRPSHHKPTDLEAGRAGSNKRRKVGETDDVDMEIHRPAPADRYRRSSQASMAESLPAYDDYRSPSYEEANPEQSLVTTRNDSTPSPNSSWQSRLMLSTSGLSVAMSEESLQRLKYCLSWLRWANQHIGNAFNALKSLLEQYDTSTPKGHLTNAERNESGQLILHDDANRSALNARIGELKAEILKTLKGAVDIVSKYTGSALPENARVLVKNHLISLPQRFAMASTKTAQRQGANEGEGRADGEMRDSAHRVMVLAKEGLDMMAQVSGVLEHTLVSAEEWCERLGRKKAEEKESQRSDARSEKEVVGQTLAAMSEGRDMQQR